MQKFDLGSNSWCSYAEIPDEIKMSSEDFKSFWREQPEDSSIVIIFGKQVQVPRKQQSYGLSYKFSGTVNTALPITPLIQKYIDYANSIDDSPGEFNMALVNWYKDGNSYIGFHSDDEKQILKGSSIYCFSFGATRDFQFKERESNKTVLSIPLDNNSLVIMGGDCQKTHKHAIPKRLKVKTVRISITLRKFT